MVCKWMNGSLASNGKLIQHNSTTFRSPFLRDYGAIIHSSKFRRLSNKTQVYLNPLIDYPRTRLPHSVEVSQVARQLVRAFCELIEQQSKLEYDKRSGCNFDRDFEDLVASAALAHDLGQPPFGHAGERTLAKKTGSSGVIFDANKQNVRLLLGSEAREPLEVSCALVDAVIKYKDISCFSEGKRPGFYKFEQEAVTRITSENGTGLDKRHPACFLMEAADDIAYIAGDIEDAIKIGLLDHSHFSTQISMLPVLDDDYNLSSISWNDLLNGPSAEHISSALLKALISHTIEGLKAALSGVSLADIPDAMNTFYKKSQ